MEYGMEYWVKTCGAVIVSCALWDLLIYPAIETIGAIIKGVSDDNDI